MKIRTSFVANSSSSSFIIAWPRVPKSARDVKDILFGHEDVYTSPYDDWKNPGKFPKWPAQHIANIVWDDIKSNLVYLDSRAAIRRLLSEIGSGYMPGVETPKYSWHEDVVEDVIEYHTRSAKFEYDTAVAATEWLKENKGAACFSVVEYSDNDGDLGIAMEHGPLFDRVEHIKVSHH